MRQDLSISAFTLDALIRNWCEEETLRKWVSSRDFPGKSVKQIRGRLKGLRAEFGLTAKHVMVVDESNMIRGSHWDALLKKIESSGTRQICLGDGAQIGP